MGYELRVTQEKITRLIEEIRAWDLFFEPPATVEDLAEKYGLDPFVVDRVTRSEGFVLNRGHTAGGLIFETAKEAENAQSAPEYIDEDAVTEPIEPVVDEDADTGVYKRNSETGEFERQN